MKNFKPAEFLKDQLYYAGLDIQVDVFILISAICALPFFLIAAFTTPFCILLGILAAFIPFVIVKFLIMKRTNLFTQRFLKLLIYYQVH